MLKVILKLFLDLWIELRNVSDALEQQCISKFACPLDEFTKLAFSSKHVCISLISRQVNS